MCAAYSPSSPAGGTSAPGEPGDAACSPTQTSPGAGVSPTGQITDLSPTGNYSPTQASPASGGSLSPVGPGGEQYSPTAEITDLSPTYSPTGEASPAGGGTYSPTATYSPSTSDGGEPAAKKKKKT